ncbi:hypothetical protein NPIL_485211 [Nephila pilipes]|uniref:C2H2-type domain-containing protein n=1 Tax=Nephila pilipes TaxID=299642 RepID=A0A8X6T0L3_NEPPI|nr:hypothetical protein NPIL_485211 [Nephila pilipes]
MNCSEKRDMKLSGKSVKEKSSQLNRKTSLSKDERSWEKRTTKNPGMEEKRIIKPIYGEILLKGKRQPSESFHYFHRPSTSRGIIREHKEKLIPNDKRELKETNSLSTVRNEIPQKISDFDASFKSKEIQKENKMVGDKYQKLHCGYCKELISANDFAEHQWKHNIIENPYRCEICKKRFQRKGHLNEHVKCHPLSEHAKWFKD